MRLGFHLQPAIGNRNTGIGIYTQSLYDALRSELGERVIPIRRRSNAPIRTLGERLFYEQVAVRFLIRSTSPSVFHSTGISYPIGLSCRGIGTLYDLAYVENPSWAGSRASQWFWSRFVPASHRHADRIVVLSRTVADAVSEHFPEFRSRIRIIPAGVPLDIEAASLANQSTKTRFGILFVGDLSPRKNLRTLVSALPALRARGYDEPLFAVGVPPDPALIPHEWRHLIENGSIVPLGYLPRPALIDQYRSTRLLIFPSLMEGFGLPPLEALALRTPVLVSDIPVLREIGSGVYHFFSPSDPEALAESIHRLLSDSAARQAQLAAAPQFLRKYSWKDIVLRFLELYGELCETA